MSGSCGADPPPVYQDDPANILSEPEAIIKVNCALTLNNIVPDIQDYKMVGTE